MEISYQYTITNNMNSIPEFFVPEGGKTQEWCEKILKWMSEYSIHNGDFINERNKTLDNYNLYKGHFDPKQFEYVTATFGVTNPARLVNYPLMATKIERLVGDFCANPLVFGTVVTDKRGQLEKLNKISAIAAELVTKGYRQDTEELTGIKFDQQEVGVEMPETIEEFLEMDYREELEEIVYHGLRYIIQRHGLKDNFKRGFQDLCISSKEFYKCEIRMGDPYARRVDPRNLIWDINEDREDLQDCSWVAEERWMTMNEIIDEFRHYLSDKDINKLEDIVNNGVDGVNNKDYSNKYYYMDGSSGNPLRFRVIMGEWMSRRNLLCKVSENPYNKDEPFLKILPEDYKKSKSQKENIKSYPFNDVWEGAMIGHNMFIRCRRKPNQIRRENLGYANTKLSYVGAIKGNIDGTTLSIVDSLKNIQLLFNIVMFNIDLTMSRSAGKAVVYDISQKPKRYSFSEVISHAKNSGILPIDTTQEGYRATSFNQFQQVDFSLSGQITQLINLKMMLEDTAEQIVGISRASMGQMNSSDKVGNTQSSLQNSSLITMPLFYIHDKTIESVLNQLADMMKYTWRKNDKLSYLMDDKKVKFFDISLDLDLGDIGIFFSNSVSEAQKKQMVTRYAELALSNQSISIDSAIEMVDAETANEQKAILKVGLETIRKQQQKQQELQMQNQQAQTEAIKAQLALKEKQHTEELETKIEVARIAADATLGKEHVHNEHAEFVLDMKNKQEMDMHALTSTDPNEQPPKMPMDGQA